MDKQHRTPNTEHRKTVLPFFSIIIPVYNVAPYLRECLDSVLAQTFTDWECLCVDDGSTDESGAILDEYAQKDPRFRVFHKKNGGVSSARNLALDNVKGEWIGFLDGDDVLAPWTYCYADCAIKKFPNVDVIQYGTKTFPEQEVCTWNDEGVKDILYVEEDISKCLTASQVTSFFWGKIYKFENIQRIRFSPYKIGEDLLYLTQAMLRMCIQVKISAVCYGYRQRLTSVSHTSFTEQKWFDLIGYASSILEECDRYKFRVASDYIRLTVNKLVEGGVVYAYLLPNGGDKRLWNEWYAKLQRVYSLGVISLFQKVRIWVLTRASFNWVAFLLCYVPHKLKTMGIKRFWRR